MVENAGKTHYDTCWMYHLDCAVRRVARLEAEKEEWEGRRNTIADLIVPCILKRAGDDERERDSLRLEAEMRQDRAADAAEIARLCAALAAAEARAEAEIERLRGLLHTGEWVRSEGRTYLRIRMPDGADLSCRAMRDIAIDAALGREDVERE